MYHFLKNLANSLCLFHIYNAAYQIPEQVSDHRSESSSVNFYGKTSINNHELLITTLKNITI
jgi:hypothetical protein